MKRRIMLLAPVLAALSFGSLAGCAVRGAYVYAPPPPPRVEAYGYTPGPGFVWVDGFWNWGGARYAWTPGYWARPPRPHARWERGRWEHRGRGYVYQRGHWR